MLRYKLYFLSNEIKAYTNTTTHPSSIKDNQTGQKCQNSFKIISSASHLILSILNLAIDTLICPG